VRGQGNNVYIFPAMGIAVFAKARDRRNVHHRGTPSRGTDSGPEPRHWLIYPPQSQFLKASLHVATRVAEYIFARTLREYQAE
jgi:malate dehydrogenase (oxaloacetate-decarboxylating)(NADP+)